MLHDKGWEAHDRHGGEFPLRVFLALLLTVAPHARATDSIIAGTIVIVAQAKSYIIFAADSRVGASNGTYVASVDDTYCKIGPLHGNTLFAAAGIVTDPARSWSADTEMDKVLVENWHGARMGRTDGESALRQWAESIMEKLVLLPRNQLVAYTRSNDGVAATGVLAGIDKDGSPWVHVSTLKLDGAHGLVHQESDKTSRGSATRYSGLGQSEIAVEFDHGSTDRAIDERAQWTEKNLSGIEFDRFKARRLVEVTIQYLPNKSDVGGPVDELELDVNGAHWIQVKPHCAPQNVRFISVARLLLTPPMGGSRVENYQTLASFSAPCSIYRGTGGTCRLRRARVVLRSRLSRLPSLGPRRRSLLSAIPRRAARRLP